MSVRLKEQLSEGWYEMSFYYSLANYSAFQVDSLGVMFTDTIAEGRTAGLTKNFRPQLTRGIKNDTLEWQLFAGYFKASGNERYLTIGTPKRSRARGRKRTTVPPYIPTIADKGKFAYYFFDAVSLTRKEPAVKVEKKTVATGTPVIPQASLPHKGVFEEITFDNNKSELPRSSYKELDDLVKYLKENESLNLMLEGHTDDNGSEKDNLILSEKRAAAVASYITSRGVSATRVTYKGYGSSRPLKPNDSEENRRTNRRVQFILE
jgi:outer membrane protein OmpA-like peptidoglycan-associated protein